MIIFSAWWNLTSSKLKKSEAKLNQKTRKQRQPLSESGFVLYTAPPSFARIRRMQMRKSSSSFGPDRLVRTTAEKSSIFSKARSLYKHRCKKYSVILDIRNSARFESKSNLHYILAILRRSV